MADTTRHHAGAYKIEVSLDGTLNGSYTNLGYTESGFDWRIKAADPYKILEDRFGRAPINGLLLGIEEMSIDGMFTWFTQALQQVLNPQINWSTGNTAYAAGTQISPGYGNGTGALGLPLRLTRITGTMDQNTLGRLLFPRSFSRGDMILKLAATEITKSRAIFDAYPSVGSTVTGDDGAGTPEAHWFTPTWGATS